LIQSLTVFLSGILFAIGLVLSGMTDADKVIGFLNLAGVWDPSLIFVMLGAVGAHLFTYRLILKRRSPLFAPTFYLPTRRDIDSRLIIGSALFGIGWGIGGFCPGPAIASVVTLGEEAVIFTVSMIVGMIIFHAINKRLKTSSTLLIPMTEERSS
jgi:uncharacterized protein